MALVKVYVLGHLPRISTVISANILSDIHLDIQIDIRHRQI